MSTAFTTTRRVEFSDTDAAGLMHFAAFFRLMEQAEHELLRSVGLSVHMPSGQETFSWPRVSAQCDFRAAARFEDILQIEVRIVRLGTRSVTYGHRFLLGSSEVASGQITTVYCRLQPGLAPEPTAIPASMADKLRPFVTAAE